MLQDGLCEELADAIEDAISPRMRLMQQGKAMEDFLGFFRLRADAMVKGANVVLFFDQTGTLNMAVRAPVASGETEQPISGTVNWLSGVPEQSWANPALCRALLEAWLGEKTLVPACTPVFAAGAKALLESENIRRQTRKGGSG